MAWHHLAARLGMTIQACMRGTTSTEFVRWQEFFVRELQKPRREDYYAAQIAAEVRRTIAKHPKLVMAKHFLLDFTGGETKPPPTEEEIGHRVSASKAKWFGIAQPKKHQ